jgi:effector-binding domain-containing protein
MKTLKRIFIVVVILLLILIVISYLLPGNYTVKRDIYIKADRSVIFDLTSNFTNWDLWTPWTKAVDSTVDFELVGPESQVGTQWKWNGKVLGNGEMTITEIKPDELIAYDLSFDHGKYQSKGKLIIEAQGDSNNVSWFDEGNLGYNPISRYMGLFMDKMMGPDFEKGLDKLKKVAEVRNHWPKIEKKMMPEQLVLLIRDSAGPATYGKIMGKAFGEVMGFVKSNKLICTSAPFAIYIKWDSVTMFSVMDLGIAVEKAVSGKGRIRLEKIPSQQVAIAHYFGGYDKTASTYFILEQYIKESGKQVAGGPWEIYITDPTTVKDTAQWATDILFPVK